ncbi:MAG TPA: DUF1559 domain-containing protein [Gemmata sp.]
MRRTLRYPSAAPIAAVGLLAVLFLVAVPFNPTQPAAAQPAAPAPLPTELTFVPHDAALFLYVDAAQVWAHEVTKALRTADKITLPQVEESATKALGMKIEELKSVVVFFPAAKQPEDMQKAGFVFTFTKPFDQKKLAAGFAELFPKALKPNVSAPNDRTAVALVGLDDSFAKPKRPAVAGPLSAAIQTAASGKHAVVAGATFANLPDELRKDDLPGPVRGFQPVFLSESLTATVSLGTSLDLAVRVKSKRAAQAGDAEKALAALTKLFGDELTRELPDLEKEAATDAALKDTVKVLRALVAAAKGAKFDVEGTEARMAASLPLKDLPLVSAYTAATKKARQSAAAQVSANNLKQIALALHNYHDVNNAFPPAAVCDKKGKPQLSWRVLILPYIEQEALYKEFKLDEPWDSDHNKKLITKMPKTFAHPGLAKPNETETYYRVFVGNGAGFDWLTGTKILGITDGTSNTLMCVTAATSVPWTKPDELEFDPEKDPSKLLGFVMNGKAQVAMFDGSVRTLSKLPSKETLKSLITRNGGEVIGNDF